MIGIAEVLAALAQIVGLGAAAIVDAGLDPATDVLAVDRQHGVDIAIARGADQHRLLVLE
jgi:hypothetical protein